MANFTLPAWLNQDNTQLVPDAMAKGAAVGAQMAQIRQAAQRLALMKAEDARQQAEFQEKAKNEAMRYQGFQNFARDREVLKSTGLPDEQASQQALMKNLHLITAGDPRALGNVLDRTSDNTRQAGMLDLQRSRLDEAQRAAMARESLSGENLDLRQKRLDETERFHKESETFRREKRQGDYELDLEKEQGRNMRAYDSRISESKLEDQKQKNRLELNGKSAAIAVKLSENDRMAMRAELTEANALPADEALPMIGRINSKYERLRQGKTGYDAATVGVPVGVGAPARAKQEPELGVVTTPLTAKAFDDLPVGARFRDPRTGKIRVKTK